VLAISSGGGHWIELMRIRRAFEDCEIVFATVSDAYRSHVPDARFHVVPDATRWDRVNLARCAARVAWILAKERPDFVVSTGALPGFFGVVLGKAAGARTLWLDSIANVEELSMSGARVGRFADLWLTQWPELARPGGPEYAGAVL
jgi:UDP-N-acetylglucosamine:LPS N-acetylglucosamine transferase